MAYVLVIVLGIGCLVAVGMLGQIIGRALHWCTTTWDRPAVKRGTHPDIGAYAALTLAFLCLIAPLVGLMVLGGRDAMPDDVLGIAGVVGVADLVLFFGWFQVWFYWSRQLAEVDYMRAVRALVRQQERVLAGMAGVGDGFAEQRAAATETVGELAEQTIARPGWTDVDVDGLADRAEVNIRTLPGGPTEIIGIRSARDRVRRAKARLDDLVRR